MNDKFLNYYFECIVRSDRCRFLIPRNKNQEKKITRNSLRTPTEKLGRPPIRFEICDPLMVYDCNCNNSTTERVQFRCIRNHETIPTEYNNRKPKNY